MGRVGRVFITGDTHGNFNDIAMFAYKMNTNKSDIMIILGDSGINYYDDDRADNLKKFIESLPITVFCIHGNHEERPENIETYKKAQFLNGRVYKEDKYPSIKFGIDGELYNIPLISGERATAIVIGGAYSVDKHYRLAHGAKWFESEQPSNKTKRKVENKLASVNWEIDIVLSHTCPYNFMPREWFIGSIDQSTVDNTTEIWLDTIYKRLNRLGRWYCGHYHGDKVDGKLEFKFKSISELRK